MFRSINYLFIWWNLQACTISILLHLFIIFGKTNNQIVLCELLFMYGRWPVNSCALSDPHWLFWAFIAWNLINLCELPLLFRFFRSYFGEWIFLSSSEHIEMDYTYNIFNNNVSTYTFFLMKCDIMQKSCFLISSVQQKGHMFYFKPTLYSNSYLMT